MEKQAGGSESSATRVVGTRFWEVDSWRGVAIIAMVVYHLVFDLQAFGGLPIVLTVFISETLENAGKNPQESTSLL